MQFENQLLAQVLSTVPQQMRWAQSDVSVGGDVCLCVREVYVFVSLCANLCLWIELLFPTGLRFALAFSANHFNVIFYIISLIYQPLCLALSLLPSLSFSSPLPSFIPLFALIHCWHASLFNYHDLVRCLPLPTLTPLSPLPSATIVFFGTALKSPV